MNACTVGSVVACSPCLLPQRRGAGPALWKNVGCFSGEAACSGRKLGLANKAGGSSSPPRPLMNPFPLISGVAFEGKGWLRQLECPCLSSLGVLLLFPVHSSDRGLPDSPRVGLTQALCSGKGNFPSC